MYIFHIWRLMLNDLAVLEAGENRLQEAEQNYREALQWCRELAKHDAEAYERYFAETLNNLAFLYNNQNRAVESRADYTEALELYREFYRSDPDTYAGDVLRVEASLRELNNRSQAR
jgi:tetratricopeptide (TPR) repeat protein